MLRYTSGSILRQGVLFKRMSVMACRKTGNLNSRSWRPRFPIFAFLTSFPGKKPNAARRIQRGRQVAREKHGTPETLEGVGLVRQSELLVDSPVVHPDDKNRLLHLNRAN